MQLRYTADTNDEGKPIKFILKTKMGISERLLKRLKYNNKILCNSSHVYTNHIVNFGDNIDVFVDFQEDAEGIIPEDIEIDIIYEDDCLIAINKASNMVVHPTCGHQSGTVANAIMYHYRANGEAKKIRPVSRLDRGTSGIIVFAKNEFIQESLIRQMNDKLYVKEYLGIVSGIIEKSEGTIDLPIERMPGSIMQRQVSPSGDPSVTHYKLIEYLKDASLLSFTLETGRTHQIRVHSMAIGHPLIGDTLYSEYRCGLIDRQALHSYKAIFIHPFSKEKLTLTAPIPQDIQDLLEILRK